jgi:hypothetical protein
LISATRSKCVQTISTLVSKSFQHCSASNWLIISLTSYLRDYNATKIYQCSQRRRASSNIAEGATICHGLACTDRPFRSRTLLLQCRWSRKHPVLGMRASSRRSRMSLINHSLEHRNRHETTSAALQHSGIQPCYSSVKTLSRSSWRMKTSKLDEVAAKPSATLSAGFTAYNRHL